MLFQEIVEDGHYDLVIADESWEVDHFWHEHPELKRARSPGSPISSAICRCRKAATAKRSDRRLQRGNARARRALSSRPRQVDLCRQSRRHRRRDVRAGLPGIRDWTEQHFDFSATSSAAIRPRWPIAPRCGTVRLCARTRRSASSPSAARASGTLLRGIIEAFPPSDAASRSCAWSWSRPSDRSGGLPTQSSKSTALSRISDSTSPPATSPWCRVGSPPAWSWRRRSRSSTSRCGIISSRTCMCGIASTVMAPAGHGLRLGPRRDPPRGDRRRSWAGPISLAAGGDRRRCARRANARRARLRGSEY